MPTVTVIGGANIDIQGFPRVEPVPGDSNPGTVTFSPGGVGRNIAENAARLGLGVRFLSAFAADGFARIILDGLHGLDIDTGGSLIVPEGKSPVYLCILDHARRLYAAVSDMEIVDRLGPDWLAGNAGIIRSSDLCAIDANLPQETIEAISRSFPGLPLLLDPVSVTKAARARGCVGRFRAIKPNVAEAEALSGIPVSKDGDLTRAADFFHARGTALVFISLGARGLYFSGEGSRGIAATPMARAVNVSGAGDAATAGIVYGVSHRLTIQRTARLAIAASTLAALSVDTVNPAICPESVESMAERVTLTAC